MNWKRWGGVMACLDFAVVTKKNMKIFQALK